MVVRVPNPSKYEETRKAKKIQDQSWLHSKFKANYDAPDPLSLTQMQQMPVSAFPQTYGIGYLSVSVAMVKPHDQMWFRKERADFGS